MEVRRIFAIPTVILLAYTAFSVVGEGNTTSFSKINMILGDRFILALSPPVENIQVYVGTATGKGYSYLVLTNSSFGIPDLPGRATQIQLIPEDPLTNITVVFNSSTPVKILYGVLTVNYTYYKQVSSTYYTSNGVFFIVLQPQVDISAGEWRITFIINTVNMQEVKGGFRIELPPLATVIPIIIAIAFLVYLSAYVIVDSYYVSTREELSRARKFGIVLLLILSALAIYWLTGLIIKF